MKCRKQLVLTGYRVQFVDLREPKPRTPQEQIYVVDGHWLDSMVFVGINAVDAIKSQYEEESYKVFNVEPIKPKRVTEINLCQFWELAAATEETPSTTDREVYPE